jgi:hypothetical protein
VILIWLLLALFVPSSRATHSLTLNWEASPDSSVTGYILYYGTATRQYTRRFPVGRLRKATVSGLIEGVTYFFAVTTCDVIGRESLPSSELSYTVPGVFLTMSRAQDGAAAPGQFQVASAGVVPFAWLVDASDDLKHWHTVLRGANSVVRLTFNVTDAPRMFFRLRQGISKAQLPAAILTISHVPSKLDAFQITSTDIIPYAWVLETTTDFESWEPCLMGSNSVVNAMVKGSKTSSGFFRVRSQ